MPPLRVASILNIFPKLSETFIAGELAELRRRGVELRILSLLPPREEPRHEIVSHAGLDRMVSYDVPSFAEIVRDFRPALIHAHFAREATAKARELSQFAGIPFFFTAHGYDIHRKPPPDLGERALAAAAVITVSAFNARHLHERFGVPLSQIHVIPCGIDTDRFCPRPSGDHSNRAPLIVCVARQVEIKNLELLLVSLARLRKRGILIRCLMLGDGPLRPRLLNRRHELDLDALVEMPGAASQSEVLDAWRQADIGVLTSDNEGMPVSLMEAAACGVPVVATRVGGVPELVQEGLTGLLARRGDAEDVADKLLTLVNSPTLRVEMGEASRRHAVKHFSVGRQVESLLRVWLGATKEACA